MTRSEIIEMMYVKGYSLDSESKYGHSRIIEFAKHDEDNIMIMIYESTDAGAAHG